MANLKNLSDPDPELLARRVRQVAGRANKPGYGPLVEHTGEMSLPKGFHYVHFGDAYTRMSDGFLTPPCHDGTTVFPEGKGIVRMIRNHEGYGQGETRGGEWGSWLSCRGEHRRADAGLREAARRGRHSAASEFAVIRG
ncbi:MAG: hypothetical protein ACRDPE_01560 [Solirubrobacterales bacterium]